MKPNIAFPHDCTHYNCEYVTAPFDPLEMKRSERYQVWYGWVCKACKTVVKFEWVRS